jgi:hypothetical protein
VIELPWDHVENLWEFTSIAHEVGHDLEGDLQLRPLLKLNLDTILPDAGVPQARIETWKTWEGEVFADLVGLQLVGPALTETLFDLLLWPAKMVTTLKHEEVHPTPYLRILLNVAYIKTLVPGTSELENHANEIRDKWLSIYGEQPQFSDFIDDFPHVFRALMDTPMQKLKNNTVRHLMPYTISDDRRIRHAANYLLTGNDAPDAMSLKPRQCISAARLAVTGATRGLEAAVSQLEPDENKRLPLMRDKLKAHLQKISTETAVLVKENTSSGLRAAEDSKAHKEFVASFIDII